MLCLDIFASCLCIFSSHTYWKICINTVFYIYMYIYVHTYIYIYMSIYIDMYMSVVYEYRHIYVCMYRHIYVKSRVYIGTCTRISKIWGGYD